MLLVSCENKEETVKVVPDEDVPGYVEPAPMWRDGDFTRWMSRAELLHHLEMSPAEKYFAFVEGRNNRGLAEFRAVERDLPQADYTDKAAFWGIGEKEVFDKELPLLRAGFQRQSTQVFFDPTGAAIHQIVWLRPVGAVGDFPPEEEQRTADVTEPIMPEPVEDSSGSDTEPPSLLPLEGEIPPIEPITLEPVVPIPGKTYVVVKGDTLGRIARRHKTTVSALKKRNGLSSDFLRIGQRLKIP